MIENDNEMVLLGKRMEQLRNSRGLSLSKMAEKIQKDSGTTCDSSTLHRAENARHKRPETVIKWAKEYCRVLDYPEEQLLRGARVVVPDTSALMKNPQLIDELAEEYNHVVIPDIVVDELNRNKNRSKVAKRAWEITKSIGSSDNKHIEIMKYESGDGQKKGENVNDKKIISVARKAADKYSCRVDILTDDADYSAFLKGDMGITALWLKQYIATKQKIVNMAELIRINRYYADSYDKISPPAKDEINAYLEDGNTLIISTVRSRKKLEQRKEKIRWLIANGADVNMRDCKQRYFPALTHAVQMNDYDIFIFLLRECHANPNIQSKNPYRAEKLGAKNEGNTPLMVAAYHGRTRFVEALLRDERTSINQQDRNGFTALIKAGMKGHRDCMELLKKTGADQKIIDLDLEITADEYYERFGRTEKKKKKKKKASGAKK